MKVLVVFALDRCALCSVVSRRGTNDPLKFHSSTQHVESDANMSIKFLTSFLVPHSSTPLLLLCAPIIDVVAQKLRVGFNLYIQY